MLDSEYGDVDHVQTVPAPRRDLGRCMSGTFSRALVVDGNVHLRGEPETQLWVWVGNREAFDLLKPGVRKSLWTPVPFTITLEAH